jgi:magnesium transporter
MPVEVTIEFVENVVALLEAKKDDEIRGLLEELHAVEIDSILYELNGEQAHYILSLLDDKLSAEIISNLEEEIRPKFLKRFGPKELAQLLAHIDSDDAADILNEQSLKRRQKVLAYIEDEETLNNILDLLQYEEDTAGGLMAKEFIVAQEKWNVTQCIDEIRRQAEEVEKVFSVYVVDEKGRLKGRVSMKKLLLASEKRLVSEIYETDIQSVITFAGE